MLNKKVAMNGGHGRLNLAPVGTIGTIIHHDVSDPDLPYKVKWDNGAEGWYGKQHVTIIEEDVQMKPVLLTTKPIKKYGVEMHTTSEAILLQVADLKHIKTDVRGAHFMKGDRVVKELFERKDTWCYREITDATEYQYAYTMLDGQLISIVEPNIAKAVTVQYPLNELYVVHMEGDVGSIKSGDVVRLVDQSAEGYFGPEAYLLNKINCVTRRWVPSSATLTPFK